MKSVTPTKSQLRKYRLLQQFLIEEQSKLNYEIEIYTVGEVIEYMANISSKATFKQLSANGESAEAYAYSEVLITNLTTNTTTEWWIVGHIKEDKLTNDVFFVHKTLKVRAGDEITKFDNCRRTLLQILSKGGEEIMTLQHSYTFMYHLTPVLCG